MKKYYFTYGFEDHPFVGGWTVVEAENYDQAVELFCMIHPRKSEHDCVNCAGIYDEEHFKKTTMYNNGNLGVYAHERIYIRRELKI